MVGLNKLFYQLKEPSSFSSSLPLRYASGLSGKSVEKYLKSQDTWTRYKAIRHRFPRRRTSGVAVFSHIQCDLIQMENPRSNNNFAWCLTIIDCYSRYAFALPLRRKTGQEVAAAFEKCFDTERLWPSVCITDAGREFLNSWVRELFRVHLVNHVTTNSLLKATMVERYNKTLQNRLYKLMFYRKSKRWVDDLQQVVDAINRSYHRGIKTTPHKAFHGVTKPSMHNYNRLPKSNVPKYRVGERVRLTKKVTSFQRGYKSGWTEQTFLISEVLPPADENAEPWSYRVLSERSGEIVPGIVYAHEIVNAN